VIVVLVNCGVINCAEEEPLRSACAIIASTTLLVSLFSLSGYSQVPVSKSDQEKDATCLISGMVVKLADGAPLKGATVRVENDEDREHTIAAKTTADGRFELRNIPAGRYKLIISRNGYVAAEYGQKKPSDPGAAFSISPGGDKKRVTVPLDPGSSDRGPCF
jgi:5-hydroxyisourate hydrolase-like protein (transthyretin family)